MYSIPKHEYAIPSQPNKIFFNFLGVSAPAATSAPPAPVSAAPAAPLDFSSAAASTKASDDLLQLSGNPFANMLNGV